MLKIREEQLEPFSSEAMTYFETRAVAHLRRDLVKQTGAFSDDDLRTRVRQCISRAAQYGLTTEKQVMCFVDVTYLLGPNFDSDPRQRWANELLRSSKVASADKGNLLLATACSVYKELASGQ